MTLLSKRQEIVGKVEIARSSTSLNFAFGPKWLPSCEVDTQAETLLLPPFFHPSLRIGIQILAPYDLRV